MDPLVAVEKLSLEQTGQSPRSLSAKPLQWAAHHSAGYIRHAVAVILVLLMWLAPAHAQLPFGPGLTGLQKKAEPELRITGFGRFQVFISPSIKGETFMIDTDTGKVWIFMKDHATGQYSLKRLSVEQVDVKPNTGENSDKSPEN